MQRIGEYLLRNPLNAAWIALVLASINLVLPICGWVVGVIIAIVTLRKGWRASLPIVVLACVPGIVQLFFPVHNVLFIVNVIAAMMTVWLLACLLHRTVSWSVTIQTLAIAFAIVIVIIHVVYPDITSWWATHMQDYLAKAEKQMQLPVAEQQVLAQRVSQWAKLFTGLQLASLLMTGYFWLILARWWQAVMFNPGKLKPELHNIRINRLLAIMIVAALLLASITKAAVCFDVLPVLIIPTVVAGLSLFHCFAATRKSPTMWVTLFYAFFVMAMITGVIGVMFLMLLMIFAMLDSFMNLRLRFKTQAPTGSK
tara:strand:- start:29994 stop:30929 length:936 start_codon:yes stop_codon:yes gene_type:complete